MFSQANEKLTEALVKAQFAKPKIIIKYHKEGKNVYRVARNFCGF